MAVMDLESIYQQGFALRCEGRYPEARTELMKVLSVDPSHLRARHQIGLIQGFEGDFEGSLATLESLAKQHPNDLDVKYDLAMTQMMLGMYEEACGHLREILAVDPTHEKALQQVSYC